MSNYAQTQISPKTKAAAVGGGGAFGASVVVVWLLGMFNIEVPAEVAIILGGAVVWAFGTLAAYLKADPLRGEIFGEVVAEDHLARPGEVVDPDAEGLYDHADEFDQSDFDEAKEPIVTAHEDGAGASKEIQPGVQDDEYPEVDPTLVDEEERS